MPNNLRARVFFWIGVCFVAVGLICNQWLLTAIFSPHGDILFVNKVLISVFDFVAIAAGGTLLFYRERLARVDGKSWLLLVISACFSLVVLEFCSYLILRNVVAYHTFDENLAASKDSQLTIFDNSSEILYGVKRNYRQRFSFPEFQTEIHTNNVGFREERDFLGEKIDIGFVGDSFTFGHGVNFGERYSDLLRADFPGKYIASLSYPNGWAPPHYYLFLKHNPQYMPRILIVGLFLGNDLTSDMEATDFVFDANHELVSAKTKFTYVRADGSLTRKPKNWLERAFHIAEYTYFGRVMVIAYGRQIGIYQGGGEKSKKSELTPFFKGELNETNVGSLEYVEKLKQLADKQGTKVFVFIIPEQFSVGNYPDRCQFIQRLCQELRDRHYLQDAVSNWLTSRHIEVIDPTARFIAEENRGNRLYFRWDSHWNVNGHRAAARVIADHLKASPQAIAGF